MDQQIDLQLELFYNLSQIKGQFRLKNMRCKDSSKKAKTHTHDAGGVSIPEQAWQMSFCQFIEHHIQKDIDRYHKEIELELKKLCELKEKTLLTNQSTIGTRRNIESQEAMVASYRRKLEQFQSIDLSNDDWFKNQKMYDDLNELLLQNLDNNKTLFIIKHYLDEQIFPNNITNGYIYDD